MTARDRAEARAMLEKMLATESRWKRKRTIAENKLAEVRDAINKLADKLAGKAE